jgi:hypothetical protein
MPTMPPIPTIHLGWLAPEALAAEPYREVFELALRAYGWPQIRLDDGLTDRGWAGFAYRRPWSPRRWSAPRSHSQRRRRLPRLAGSRCPAAASARAPSHQASASCVGPLGPSSLTATFVRLLTVAGRA